MGKGTTNLARAPWAHLYKGSQSCIIGGNGGGSTGKVKKMGLRKKLSKLPGVTGAADIGCPSVHTMKKIKNQAGFRYVAPKSIGTWIRRPGRFSGTRMTRANDQKSN